MSVPSSMVHRSGNGLVVRSLVSGDALFETSSAGGDADDDFDAKELPDCKVKRNYTCSNCDFFTQNPRVYLYHLRDVHNEKVKVYECPSCLYASKHFQKLLRHKKMVHGTTEVTEVKGKKKQEIVPEDEEMKEEEERQQQQQQNLFKCSVCDFSSRSQVQLTKHEKEEHIKTKFFRCSKCTYVTHIKARFTKHVKYHSMPMIKCDMCDFRTPYKWNLDRHCKNHNGHGAFRCSACNFTADIKQSLTVHEMNHHVPPVGQAAGLGVGRRRNKVGASDTTAAEEQAAQQQVAAQQVQSEQAADRQPVQQQHDSTQAVKSEPESPPAQTTPEEINAKLKVAPLPGKKLKTENSDVKNFGGSDFINPDDIIHHANGKVYIKNKCKLCNFKTAWDSEMAKHEAKVHNINKDKDESKPVTSKKPSRPVPNLIPIPSQPSVLKPQQHRPVYPVLKTFVIPEPSEQIMSQKEISDICAKSSNSVLKDFASLFSSEEMFKCSTPKVPDLIPASMYTSSSSANNKFADVFKQKNASFFDNLREKLELGTGGSSNLTCKICGHKSKCLTEHAKHQKTCGRETNKIQYAIPKFNISSSRCQFCRQRCKSSVDLYNHLQSCPEAMKVQNSIILKEEVDSEPEGELKIDEDHVIEDNINRPHPMENKVFVWNDILVPMDIEVDHSIYEYTEDKVDDNVSLDLSIRTQSPLDSENSYIGQDLPGSSHPSPLPSSTDKIPTHGNDISVAQHKRVFKCPHCTFWASTASRFHVHIVGHLNKKPFECSLCAYRSNWRWDITKHIKLKSVRDPAHESAKVLMTDETGRRNYTKYNKYLTEIPISSEQSMDTSGGCGTRPKHHDRTNSPSTSKSDLPRLSRAPNSSDFSPLLKTTALRPPPALKVADGALLAKISDKKRSSADGKKTLFKCKKCNFKDASRDILLDHVKGHYQQQSQHQHHPSLESCGVSLGTTGPSTSSSGGSSIAQDFSLRGTSPDRTDEASVNNIAGGAKGTTTNQAPFRCGHCNQVSNWKHVIQRHCRLKHSGDIRVVSTKNGQEKIEIEELTDEPDHIDVTQEGTFKCTHCPYSTDNHVEYEHHLSGHVPDVNSIYKCFYCKFFVSQKEDLIEHLKLHGISDPENFLAKMNEKGSGEGDGKKFKCIICPYVTNSKSQYTYHKQFHKPRGGPYTCAHCSYNVSKRHLLHQHLKVHGINITSHKQNGEVISLDDITDEIEEVSSIPSQLDLQNFLNFPDIPLVWVSKNGKFSKMFKCRYCPHVNLRKVNIQEHEKMHSTREKNPNSTRVNDVEHRCTECNYICNNAGVLSSHSKVHQGLYGVVHRLVDPTKTDEEQIRELSKAVGVLPNHENGITDELDVSESSPMETDDADSPSGSILYFCNECPARFLKENEFGIHKRFHGSRLFYKCDYCTYTSRERPYLFSHFKVHTTEYQERTKVLQNTYITNNSYPQPQTYITKSINGKSIWVVSENTNKSSSSEMSTLCSILSKPVKSSQCVPLSGTDLFLQKSEAEQKHAAEMIREASSPSVNEIDPELIKGDPNFIYPTTLKNGVMKEKRFKCHKCPSAFEKKEQYKVHLGLHGSNQRYKCDHCDYSVKYYANYIQHLKKHKLNAEAKARRSSDELEEVDESVEIINGDRDKGQLNLSIADQQAAVIQQIRQNDQLNEVLGENKKVYWCICCPYGTFRKDSIENHQKRHIRVSGVKSTYTCEHCDYSVPQSHVLKEHIKWHFCWKTRAEKLLQDMVSGYLHIDDVKLTSKHVDEASSSEEENSSEIKSIIFEEHGSKSEEKTFSPPLDEEIVKRFNNNEGEKQYINVQTGELVDRKKTSDTQFSNSEEDCKMEVI